jgi:hypothetical protein
MPRRRTKARSRLVAALLAVQFSFMFALAGGACCPFEDGHCESDTPASVNTRHSHQTTCPDAPEGDGSSLPGFCSGPNCLCHQPVTSTPVQVVVHDLRPAGCRTTQISSHDLGVIFDILHIPIV